MTARRAWLTFHLPLLSIVFALTLAACTPGSNAEPGVEQSSIPTSEWPLLGGNNDQWQYSALTEINEQTVAQLGLAWSVDLPVRSGLTGNPLVADGVVYNGAPGGRIFAHDVQTGKEIWAFEPEMSYADDMSIPSMWATHFNRGLAIDQAHAYISTGDCRLVAVDRKSGKQVWQAMSCDPRQDLGAVAAPRVGGGKVFIGNTNIEFGTARGYVDAFDAATGKRLWRFYTMPGDPAKGFENKAMEMASKTWGTDYWKYEMGSVAPWEGITYDEKLDLVYIGTGNPEPRNPANRVPDAGDELFSNSIVAVSAGTGEYVWHYQTVSNDGWTSDATPPITIAELPIDGTIHRVVMQASKNAFFYVLDAKTGRFISGDKFAPNNWATGIDPKTGKIIIPDSSRYWESPNKTFVVQPGAMGAHGWTLMAYNPSLRLVYIPAFVLPDLIAPHGGTMEARRRERNYGLRPDAEYKTKGTLVAWDPIARKERWHVDQPLPINGGALSTAGNLVFQGTADGRFVAYAADTGRQLWSFNAHSTILAAPSTVRIGKEQFIIVPIGNGASASAGQTLPYLVGRPDTRGPSRLLAFKLGGTGQLPANTALLVPKPFRPRQPQSLAARGQALYNEQGCVVCHGADGIGGGGKIPDLRKSSQDTFAWMADIVINGRLRPLGMPAFPKLTNEDVVAMQAFITNAAWDGYEDQEAKASDVER